MATATVVRAWPREMWEARALELAEEKHTTGTARELASNELHAVYAVRKDSALGEYLIHVVQLGDAVHRLRCDCLAGQHGRPCKHVGATLHALRQRERAIAQPDTDPLASWRRGFDY